MKMTYMRQALGVSGGFAFLMGASAGCIVLNAAAAPDPTCVSYLTVGDSDCKPQPLQVPQQPAPRGSVESMAAPETKSEVDKYLDNYGKPPREFVEFYLNPTAENASKWVQTYQQLLQKGQNLSSAWNDAEQLYQAGQAPSSQAFPARLVEPSMVPAQVAPNVPVAVPSPVAPMSSQGVGADRFGAFANAVQVGQPTTDGIRSKGVSLTYFFSQTCPYCTRMTPELAVMVKQIPNKLAFTCVDVTPVGATSRPDAGYITSKLPCEWRLPNQGEIEMEQVSQTPTLVIQKEGQRPVRLSGYVPLAQLRGYF